MSQGAITISNDDANRRKGFTLVELIVVLVILAILAAVVIPSLIEYIDKAKQRKFLMDAHYAVESAQYIAIEDYALGTSFDTWRGFTNITNDNAEMQDRIYELSGLSKNEYVIANADINSKGEIIFLNLYSKQTVGNNPVSRVVYMNGTIGGKVYDHEYIIVRWNGVDYEEYRKLDPAQVGYKQN